MIMCDDDWHIYQDNAKRCQCGARTSPVYRSWLRKRLDRIALKGVQRRRARRVEEHARDVEGRLMGESADRARSTGEPARIRAARMTGSKSWRR